MVYASDFLFSNGLCVDGSVQYRTQNSLRLFAWF
jgi:hypothetical protein